MTVAAPAASSGSYQSLPSPRDMAPTSTIFMGGIASPMMAARSGMRRSQARVELGQVDEVLEVEDPPQDHLDRHQRHQEQQEQHRDEADRAHIVIHAAEGGEAQDDERDE